MNQVTDLFRRTTRLFTAHPILWLLPLLADVFRSLLQWASRPLTRAALMAAAPKSALGGSIAGAPSARSIALIGGGIGLLVTALGLLAYLYALGVVARSLDPDATNTFRKPVLRFEPPRGLIQAWWKITALAVVFVLYSSMLVTAFLVPQAARAGLKVGAVQFLLFALVAPVLMLLLYLSIDILRTYVLKAQAQPMWKRGPRLPYFLLMVVSGVVSNAAALGIGALTGRGSRPGVALIILQVLASAATAFPYAYAITGLSLALPNDPPNEATIDDELTLPIAPLAVE